MNGRNSPKWIIVTLGVAGLALFIWLLPWWVIGFGLDDFRTKYGYINRQGEVVIPAQFSSAGDFSEGLAAVLVNDGPEPHGYGFIDTVGKMVIAPRFRNAHRFSEGLAAVSVPHPAHPDDPEDEIWGVIDKSGRFVVEPKFGWIDTFSEGLAAYCERACYSPHPFTAGANRDVGYIDKLGHIVIPPLFYDAKPFSEGLAAAFAEAPKAHLKPRYGYIDHAGRFVIAPQFERVGRLAQGLAAADRGFIDRKGNYVITVPDGAEPHDFSDGLGRIDYKNEFDIKTHSVFIDPQGAEFLRVENAWNSSFHEGLLGTNVDGRDVFIDKEKNIVLEPKTHGYMPVRFSEGLAVFDVLVR
jgi:hypothetical protein